MTKSCRTFLNNLKILSKKFFSINNFDSHLVVYLLGIHFKKKIKNNKILDSVNKYGLNIDYRDKKIICSLTSFPERINIVSKTISTLLNQTIKPDKLILWLAQEQFPKKEDELPEDLLNLKKFGLSIQWCNDIKSYKKLIPTLKEYPDDIIITFDDDIYYPKNTIEILYNSYIEDKSSIQANRVRRFYIKYDNLYSVSSAEMYWCDYKEPSYLNKLTGCGGVLYPPHSLSEEVFNEVAFNKIVPTQDDVWFWAMALLNRTKIKQVAGYKIQLATVENSQKCGLSKINKKQGYGVDSLEASRQMLIKYPQLKSILMEDANAF